MGGAARHRLLNLARTSPIGIRRSIALDRAERSVAVKRTLEDLDRIMAKRCAGLQRRQCVTLFAGRQFAKVIGRKFVCVNETCDASADDCN